MAGQAIDVRAFTEDLLEAATSVFIRAFAEKPWSETWPRPNARRRISDIVKAPGFLGIASFKGPDLIGFLLGRIEAYRDEEHFYLQEICVVPECQRQGVGRLMLRDLHRRLEVAGCHQIYLLTARESRAERFYLQNGYGRAHRTGVLVSRLR